MTNKMNELMTQAVVEFARNGLEILSGKYGGDCTLNEANESTPDDLERSVQWVKDFRKHGLPE